MSEEYTALGRPVMKPLGFGTPDHDLESGSSVATMLDEGRHPADELGRPRQIPTATRQPTEAELTAVRDRDELDARRIYAEIVQQATLTRFNRWRRSANTMLLTVVLAVLAIGSLFAFSQSIQILAALATQPLALQIAGYAGLALLLGVLVFFAARMLAMFYRLRVNQQISTRQLQELSRRAELRDLARRDKAAAKTRLEAYLREYPLDGPELGAIEAVGLLRMDAEGLRELRTAREFLLDADRFADYDSWLVNFREKFQDKLGAKANQVVRDWMKMVGIQTALSPKSWIDSVVVLYCSYGMIGDLCRLYNLRMTGPGIARLLAYSLFNSYAAGQIKDFAQSLDVEAMAHSLDMDSVFDVCTALGGGLKALLPKVADGAANALLTNRLGRTTIRLLSPVD